MSILEPSVSAHVDTKNKYEKTCSQEWELNLEHSN